MVHTRHLSIWSLARLSPLSKIPLVVLTFVQMLLVDRYTNRGPARAIDMASRNIRQCNWWSSSFTGQPFCSCIWRLEAGCWMSISLLYQPQSFLLRVNHRPFFFLSRRSIPSFFTGHRLLHVASANKCPPGISWEVMNYDGELAVSKEGPRKEACLERCDTAKYIPTRLNVGG